MQQADLESRLRTILEDLEAYRSDMVLIGGWVPYLYRHYGGFASWSGEDTLTFELDVLVDRPLPAHGRPGLAKVLRDAGFHPVDDDRRAAAVWVRDAGLGEKVEFITVHRGVAHGQGRVVPLTDQPGLGAFPLVDLEVIRAHTRMLLLPRRAGMRPVEVQVPTLGAYVVNKALTFIRRRPHTDEVATPKLAKDLLYLRDLAAAGEYVTAAIREDAEIIARSPGGADQLRTAATNLQLAAEDHLRHHLATTAMMVVERRAEHSIQLEEARTRAFLLDVRELLMEAADRHAPMETVTLDFDADE
ncbi:GSU2403 family nucleotidyltransferase fold protein [Longimicrobium sp.]|uniref:GSU2403 family nucleotidyltransferase fold protein n=1 Tax=Longimicrobium sp. TaxID=2029185 RepID=UPI003B3A08FB